MFPPFSQKWQATFSQKWQAIKQ